ncbi:MAG: hypothetical protein ACREBN_02720 [Burkholderiaceae bacterium]
MTRVIGWCLAGLVSIAPVWAQAPAAAPAATNKPAEAVSKFVVGTRLGYITCAEKYRTYLERWELYSLMTEGQRDPRGTAPSDGDVSDCVHQTGLKGQALYRDAAKVASAPKAKSAFTEYMTAWEASLKDIRKSPRESVSAFRARQRKVEDRLNQLQTRLEASVNLDS